MANIKIAPYGLMATNPGVHQYAITTNNNPKRRHEVDDVYRKIARIGGVVLNEERTPTKHGTYVLFTYEI